MTTDAQNQWAALLETASQREVRQMAEYAVDHLDEASEANALKAYLSAHQYGLAPAPEPTQAEIRASVEYEIGRIHDAGEIKKIKAYIRDQWRLTSVSDAA